VPKAASVLFRERLRQLRTERGWTQEQAATACDISTKVYQFLENGHLDNPTLATIEKICNGFKILLRDFFTTDLQKPNRPKNRVRP
jgi:transcriptional regulator with XRE-family HTH domain